MRPMDFGYDLGPVSGWGRLECRIATAVVRAYLLEPMNDKRRVRICHVLLAAELKMLEKDALAEPSKGELLAPVKADLVADLMYIARLQGRRYFARKFSFDLDAKKARDKSRKNMRETIATGLIVEVAREAARPGEEQTVGIRAAKETIRERYKKNPVFERDETGLDIAWTRYRPVSHLAAALLRYFSDRDLRRFGPAEFRILRAEIVDFLEMANFYQHYIRDLSVQPTLRFSYDLFELPTELGLGRKAPEGALVLPEEVLRKGAT
jgi:hypothetical protein